MTTTTSRRAILAGAITMPIAAAAPALAEADDAEVLHLAAEVKAAYDGLCGACDALAVAEKPLFQWRRSNPKPKELIRALDQLDAPADADAALNDLWNEWRQREATFKRASGYDEAHAAEGVASDKLTDAIDAFREAPAHTIRGLIAKARLCEIDPDALGDEIASSIVEDLLAMAAVGVEAV
jgi:hypothetical protein